MEQITESRLQSDCYLWWCDTYPEEKYQLFMVYNNPKNQAHGGVLKAMGMVAGVSDLIYLCPDGSTHFLEAKLPGQVQSPKQESFEDKAKRLGHKYSVFCSLQDFQAIIRAHH